MKHSLSIRESKDSKKEVVVELTLPDTYAEAKVTESLVACAFRHIIIRANDSGRSVMKSADYKEKRLNDEDVKRKVVDKFNDLLTKQKYEFRTKGQAMSKEEKAIKTLDELTDEELERVIALRKAKKA